MRFLCSIAFYIIYYDISLYIMEDVVSRSLLVAIFSAVLFFAWLGKHLTIAFLLGVFVGSCVSIFFVVCGVDYLLEKLNSTKSLLENISSFTKFIKE